LFEPRREHGRFCSARCRVAWNRDHSGDRPTAGSALDWSVTAMRDATGRLLRVRALDRARALPVIGEAVWWVTIVDATLVRYHPDTYDAVLAGMPRDERLRTEGTLAGLRFVRNRMGQDLDHADFIRPARIPAVRTAARTAARPAAAWASVAEPDLSLLSPRGQAWEAARYQAYQSYLAGHDVRDTFERAAGFLLRAAAAASSGDVTRPAPRA
jgi:hypothetical protein